jgi:hypothetical protein
MINLIPPSAQKQVKHEYWIRVITLWMFMGGTACVVCAIFLIPAHVLVHNQLDSFSEQFGNATTNSESRKVSENSITEVNAISALLTKSENTVNFSNVISEIEKNKSVDIVLLDFTLTRARDVLTSVMISGSASSRATLSAFRDTLDANTLFGKVDLPLASLAKDKDIPFTITITPDKEKPK